MYAHWGMADPAEVVGTEEHRLRAFHDTVTYLSRRLDLMLALPFEKLERAALEIRLRAIGEQFAPESSDV